MLRAAYSIKSLSVIGSNSLRSGSGTATINTPTHSAGDMLIAIGIGRASNGAVTVPAGWTLALENRTSDPTVYLAYKIATGSEPTSYSFSVSGASAHSVVITSVRNATEITTIGTVTRTSSITNSALSITPSKSGMLMGAFYAEDNSRSITSPPSEMTIINSIVSQPAAYLYQQFPQYTIATGNKTVTWSGSSAFVSFLFQVN
jgi:hypothetical protein